MPLKFTCPRCKKTLALPHTVAGSYVKCGHCDGRVWVPETLGRDGERPAGAGASPSQPDAEAPDAPAAHRSHGAVDIPPPAAPTAAPGAQASTSQSSPGPAPSASPPAPWTAAGRAIARPSSGGLAGRKARFVTAATVDSRLQSAADGKLPGLRLQQDEPTEKGKETPEGSSVHPLVLFCALCLSMLVSITMVVVDFDGPQTEHSRARAQARWTIEREFFSHLDRNERLVDYQLLLREAHRAYARGDRQAEREAYRQVLRLLWAERGRFEGLTGSPASDHKLEELITVILQE